MLSLIFHEVSLVWQFDATNTRARETIFAYRFQFFDRQCERTELLCIHVREFNFVSRISIGKVGKVDLLKNDL